MGVIEPPSNNPPAPVGVDPAGVDPPPDPARRAFRHRRIRGYGWRRRSALVAAAATAIVVFGAGWIVAHGWRAYADLSRASTMFGQFSQQLARGEVGAARATLTILGRETRHARAQTRDPGWRLAGRTPRLGDDLRAVSAITATLDDLVHTGLTNLVEAAEGISLSALAPRNGTIELGAVARAAPRLTAADSAVRLARDRVAAIPTAGLHARLRSALTRLGDELGRAATMTGASARAATLLPDMLGARGPRSYLVLFQNLAEIRATGGLPGAFIVIDADRGAIRMVDHGTAAGDLKTFARPVLPLDPAMRALYTDRLATFPGDVNFTPHFPTSAALVREMYRRQTGRPVDGVIATDPVAMSYLLRATGPLTAPDGGRLTAENAVRTVLADVYARFADNTDQDRYLAGVARVVFQALVRGAADPRRVLTEFARAAGERRLLVWSARPEEERVIAGTVLEGAMPTVDGHRPAVGVFLNDGTGAKLGYYLTHTARIEIGPCRADRRRELTIRITLGSVAPRSGLPAAVLGMALAGPYTMRTNVLVFGPAEGAIGTATVDGAQRPMGLGTEHGRRVGVISVDLPPGATRTIEVTTLTKRLPDGDPGEPALWTTPGIRPWNVFIGPIRPCG